MVLFYLPVICCSLPKIFAEGGCPTLLKFDTYPLIFFLSFTFPNHIVSNIFIVIIGSPRTQKFDNFREVIFVGITKWIVIDLILHEGVRVLFKYMNCTLPSSSMRIFNVSTSLLKRVAWIKE